MTATAERARPQERFAAVDASTPRNDPHVLLQTTIRLLSEGGDSRISLSDAGVNQYGCVPYPDAALVAFGSSTASSVSEQGLRSAAALLGRLLADPSSTGFEMSLLRRSVLALTGAGAVVGTDIVMAASGTDVHLFASHLSAGSDCSILQAVMAEPDETGTGVPSALSRAHYGTRTCQGRIVPKGVPLSPDTLSPPSLVRLRRDDGTPRDSGAIDADFETLVEVIVRSGARCLLSLTDLTKTGLLAPSPACAIRLRERFKDKMDVLVDACQYRLTPATLGAYLRQGFMVAITGSKFVTGPAFCAALLLPPGFARRTRDTKLLALQAYSARCDWPPQWRAAATLGVDANIGLMLRWEAALTELRRFRAVPDHRIDQFLDAWGTAVASRLEADPAFEALPVPRIDRSGLEGAGGWDRLQTIFPFVVSRLAADSSSIALSRPETTHLHGQMQRVIAETEGDSGADPTMRTRIQLGQPVPCGAREGTQVSALRICASARWVAESATTDKGEDRAIQLAMAAFDKLKFLTASFEPGADT